MKLTDKLKALPMFGSCYCNLSHGGADCHFELGYCPVCYL